MISTEWPKQSTASDKERARHVIDAHMNALLRFANSEYGSCVYFEPPIECAEQAREAMRISLDVWEKPELIDFFASLRSDLFCGVDYDFIATWRDFLHCPLHLMQVDGRKALFLCEGTVFEAVSFGKSWKDMTRCVPDLVLTSLIPFGDVISFSGLMLRHDCPAEGPGVIRVEREFRRALEKGIVRDAATFKQRAREIRALHAVRGFDPTSYAVFDQYVNEINVLTEDTCFPYRNVARMRGWDE